MICHNKDHSFAQCKEEKKFLCLKTYIYGKTDELNNFKCGCSVADISYNLNYLKEKNSYFSNQRKYHCCICKDIIKIEKLYQIEEIAYCEYCYIQFYEFLLDNDLRKINYLNTEFAIENRVECYICKKEHRKYLSKDDKNFCCFEHQIAYIIYNNISFNLNTKIWTQINYFILDNPRLLYYNLNKNNIFKTVLLKLESLDFKDILINQEIDEEEEEYLLSEFLIKLNIKEKNLEYLIEIVKKSFDIHSEIDLQLINNPEYIKDIYICKNCFFIYKDNDKEYKCKSCENNNEDYMRVEDIEKIIKKQINIDTKIDIKFNPNENLNERIIEDLNNNFNENNIFKEEFNFNDEINLFDKIKTLESNQLKIEEKLLNYENSLNLLKKFIISLNMI
jgi:hypothetical protein